MVPAAAGNFQSFVFSLRPAAAVHRPSGANANFQWCGANFSQLPNGIGFGGQVNYFGLHLDGTLDTGMSRASATYAWSALWLLGLGDFAEARRVPATCAGFTSEEGPSHRTQCFAKLSESRSSDWHN